ncbi:MAG: hypothetical protein M3P04_11410 [Actinomycetota bacterium]|nr:hypothetical protein [Actinomycetota bacterium]
MRPTHVLRSTVAVASAVIGFALTSVAPAHAAFTEHYHETGDILLPSLEEGPDATYCGLRDVPLSFDIRGTYQDAYHGTSPYLFGSGRRVATWTWTNPGTALTFTQHNVGQSRDHSITDNGDGTITIVAHDSGMQRVYGPDGSLLFQDNGLAVYAFRIGTNGTVDPDDDTFLGPVGEPEFRGPHGTAGRDFCTDFLHYTSA